VLAYRDLRQRTSNSDETPFYSRFVRQHNLGDGLSLALINRDAAKLVIIFSRQPWEHFVMAQRPNGKIRIGPPAM